MKKSKRLVTLLLALVMLVGMFTVGANAAEAPATLTISYRSNWPAEAGKTPDSAGQTVVSGEPANLKLGWTLEGYTFVGWATSPSGSAAYAPGASYNFNGTENETLTLYAVWQKNAAGDQGGQTPVIPPVTGKTYDLDVRVYISNYTGGYNYVCNGKYPCYDADCKYHCDYNKPSYDWDDVFNPSWNPYEGPYAVNYKCTCRKTTCSYCNSYKYQNDYYYGSSYGSTYGFRAYGSGSYNAGDVVTVRAKAPSGVNYRFVGWYNVNKKFSNSMTANFTMPAADTTVYAVFQVMGYGNDYNYGYTTNCNKYHNHTIRYTDGVSNQVIFRDVVKTVKHGGTTPTISDPVRPGYRFLGWSPRVDRVATECVTYVAQWGSAVAPKLTTEHVAYMKGYGKGVFAPDNKMTRAEFAVMLYRLLDTATVKAYYTTANPFSDVKSDAWYNEAVATLANAGVIGAGATFRPTEYITRAEMISMLANFYTKSTSYSCYYKDVPASYWAYEDIALAQYMGWIKGYGANTFLPEATITRAEVAAVMNRVLDRDDCKTADTKHYTDNPTSAWFYQDVVEATVAH